MSPLFIRKSIDIDAPIATLWQVLTDARFIPQYMFGCIAETDWKPGSPLLWRGAADGKLYVKGQVVQNEPPHRLVYTIFDPSSTIRDIPANYLTMTWELHTRSHNGGGKSNQGAAVLTITQGDFSTVEDGERRCQHSLGGDDAVLSGIKRLAEEQAAKA